MQLTYGNIVRFSVDEIAKQVADMLEKDKMYNPDKQVYTTRCYYTPKGKGFIELIFEDKPQQNKGGLIVPLEQ